MLSLLPSFLIRLTPYALAIDNAPITPPKSVQLTSGGIFGVVCVGLRWLFTGAIIFSIILALVAAFDYMRSSGDPAMVKKATNQLIFVAIGVAVAILARTVPVLVGSLVGAGPASTNTSAVCR